jgi:peptidoglycan/LPS O-acetylase OafA/YrhL
MSIESLRISTWLWHYHVRVYSMSNIQPGGVHPKYRPDIDGLRAVAVVSVVGFHAFPNAVKGGFIGVDIFFVISGYLISGIIFSNLERGSFSVIDFYNRRIRRIFPALIVVMAASLIFGGVALFSDEYRELGKQIVARAGFLANIALFRESGYFDTAAETKPMLHLWSLAVEEQFYIFWPLMLCVVRKYNWSFLSITGALAVLSFAVNLYLLSWRPSAAFYWPISRFWELMIGGVLAYAALHRPEFIHRRSNAQSIIGVALLAIGLLAINKDTPFPGGWTLLPTVGSALLISAGSAAWFNKYVLSNKVMVWVGLISYPLYLWHWPLLSFANILSGNSPSNALILCAVALAFLFAWMTYQLLEKKIRFSRNRYTAIILFATLAIVGIVAGQVYARGGFPQRAIAERFKFSVADQIVFERSRVSDGSCTALNGMKLLPEEVCLSNSSAPRVMFTGDSHAVSLYGAVYAKQVQVDSIMVAGFGCPFYPNLDYTPENKLFYGNNCTAISNDVLKIAINSKSIETVVLSNVVPFYGTESANKQSVYRLNGHPLTKKEAFEVGTESFVSSLLKAGKKVVFVVDVPHLKADPRFCVERLSFWPPRQCEDTADENYAKRKAYLDAVAELKGRFAGLEVFDPTSEFCHDGWCNFAEKENMLYSDDHHLSIFGSERVLKLMRAENVLGP